MISYISVIHQELDLGAFFCPIVTHWPFWHLALTDVRTGLIPWSRQGPNANIPDSVFCVSAGVCVYEGSLHQVGAVALCLPRARLGESPLCVCNVRVFAHVLFTGDINRLAWLTADAIKCVHVKREVVKRACISSRDCCAASFVWGREDVSHL